MPADGSPTPRRGRAQQPELENSNLVGKPTTKRTNAVSVERAIPLSTSKFENQAQNISPTLQGSTQKMAALDPSSSPMEKLMAYLHEQAAPLSFQKSKKSEDGTMDNAFPSSGSLPVTPGSNSDPYFETPKSDHLQFLKTSKEASEAAELFRLRQELEVTKSKMCRMEEEKSKMEEELHQRRVTAQTVEQAINITSDASCVQPLQTADYSATNVFQLAKEVPNAPIIAAMEAWNGPEGKRATTNSSVQDRVSQNPAGWSSNNRSTFTLNVAAPLEQATPPVSHGWNMNHNSIRNGGGSSWYTNPLNPVMNQVVNPTMMGTTVLPQRGFSGLRLDTNFRNGAAILTEQAHFPADHGLRRSLTASPCRPGSTFGPRYNGYASYPTSANDSGISPPMTPSSRESFGYYAGDQAQYIPRPIGTRLSPTAAEFNVDGPKQWCNGQMINMGDVLKLRSLTMTPSTRVPSCSSSNATVKPSVAVAKLKQTSGEILNGYSSTAEPMNYRKLLDRNMSCNWKYIVDKIVTNNDQQASIFLQQKLKVGTADQKFEIVDAIIQQAIALMMNRFGNFLVQRCFEHGTQEQIIQIAQAIRGNTLMLSMDAFGCHVIQKAFDCVPEEYKAIMVHELLRRIPETVIHRYACHVWQKLFELRWSDSPPQIMKYVNEALRGMWHEVALGETGSLVVQNIFENCLEEDKRPCINEVLASIDVIAHGQFGNWCIQHICEHGATADRSRGIDHILRFATEYSMDQYASKVIEKCLKIGGTEFLDRYLERICEGRPDRPRMPLIDIAGDQFGNYLIQYILMNSSPQHREIVASHVRKHMVSLRGSKYGSRVAMLCCNPAVTTRPGPPTGISTNFRPNTTGNHRGGYYGGAYR